jgi:hypothetical protein
MRTLSAALILTGTLCLGCASGGSKVDGDSATTAAGDSATAEGQPETGAESTPASDAPAETTTDTESAATNGAGTDGAGARTETVTKETAAAGTPSATGAGTTSATGVSTSGPWVPLFLDSSKVAPQEDGRYLVEVTCRTPNPGWKVALRPKEGGGEIRFWRELEIVGQAPAQTSSETAEVTRTATFAEKIPESVKSVIIYGKDRDGNVVTSTEEVPAPKDVKS